MDILRKYWGLIVVVLLSIPTIFPFFHSGFFPMHDDTQVARVYEMGKALSDGMFPVRWVEDLGYGYGYPIFNFYSPFPYYIGGLLALVGIDVLLATKLVFILGILLSAVSMYFLVRSFASEVAAFASGVVYLYFPYHAVNIFVRGALGELYAYAFLPLVFLGLYKLYFSYTSSEKHTKKDEKKTFIDLLLPHNRRWVLLTAFGTACVILSHNLYAYMLMIILVVFTFITLLFTRKIRLFIVIFTSLFLGFLLTSFFSIPAITEMKYTNVFSQVGGGADYPDHFVCPIQLWESLWGFGGSTQGCIDGMSFRLGKFNIFLLFASLIAVFYLLIRKTTGEKKFIFITSFILFCVSLFMMTQFSRPFWELLPGSAFIQYPWRFLGFAGLFLSIFISVLFLTQKEKKFNTWLAIGIIIFTVFLHQKLFSPQLHNNSDSSFYTKDAYIKWNISKISDEYLPTDFRKPLKNEFIPSEKVAIVRGEGKITNMVSSTHQTSAVIALKEDALLKIYIADFPWWHIYDNNEEIEKLFSFNGMFITLSKGDHNLLIRYEQSDVQKLSNALTLLSIFLIIIGIIKHKRFLLYAKKTS